MMAGHWSVLEFLISRSGLIDTLLTCDSIVDLSLDDSLRHPMRERPMTTRRVDIEGAAHLVLPDRVAHLRPEAAVFAAMLAGWARQQASRR
jgi:hypothetical protein